MEELIIIEYDKEFIPVYRTEQGTEVVRGRELHKGLNVKQDFSDWIKKQLKILKLLITKIIIHFGIKMTTFLKRSLNLKVILSILNKDIK